VSSCQEFQQQARAILATPEDELKLPQVEGIHIQGTDLNVDLPELPQLELLVKRLTWLSDMDELDEHFLELHDVIRYLEQADEARIPKTHEYYVNLLGKRTRGEEWQQRAAAVIATCGEARPHQLVTLQELNDLIVESPEVPVNGEMQVKVKQIRNRALSAQQSCRSLMDLPSDSPRKTIEQLRRVVRSAEPKAHGVDIQEVKDLRNVEERYCDWTASLFGFLNRDQAHGHDIHDWCNVEPILEETLEDVGRILAPADEAAVDPAQFQSAQIYDQEGRLVNPPFSCVCRRPPSAEMVACRKCLETYHPPCLGIKFIANPRKWKCPFCKSRDEFDLPVRLGAEELVAYLDRDSWRIDCSFPERDLLTQIVDLMVRAVAKVLPAIEMGRCTDRTFLRHWAKKLYGLPFDISVKREDPGKSIVLYQDVFARLRHVIRHNIKDEAASVVKGTPKAPKIILAARCSQDGFTPCVCSTPPPDSIIQVVCVVCEQRFHASCVYAPEIALGQDADPWTCPCCAWEGDEPYEFAEVRCQFKGELNVAANLPSGDEWT
jgi:histone demethylase JARID1